MSDPIAGASSRSVTLELETGPRADASVGAEPSATGAFREALEGSRPEQSFGSALRGAVDGIARDSQRIDGIVRRAARGGTYSNEQLIAIQATVYRHAQEVELAAKLVDKLSGSVKQVLTSQQ